MKQVQLRTLYLSILTLLKGISVVLLILVDSLQNRSLLSTVNRIKNTKYFHLSLYSVIISFLLWIPVCSNCEKQHISKSFHLLQRRMTGAVFTQLCADLKPNLFWLKILHEYNFQCTERDEHWATSLPSKTAQAEPDLFRLNECGGANGAHNKNTFPHLSTRATL